MRILSHSLTNKNEDLKSFKETFDKYITNEMGKKTIFWKTFPATSHQECTIISLTSN